MRDGVNLSRTQVTRPLVMPSEITNLPDLTGYLRLGRNLPVIRFQDFYRNGPVRSPAFMRIYGPPVHLRHEEDDDLGDEAVEPVPFDPECPDVTAAEAGGDEGDRVDDAESPSPLPVAPLPGGNSIRQRSRLYGPWKPSKPA